MAVSLSKGERYSLEKNLTKISVGLSWDENPFDDIDFDLDASVFLLNEKGKVSKDRDFIFYNNLISLDGSVEHTGDNRTGSGDGDDESINIDLAKVSSYVKEIVFVVTIHDAINRRQNFGMVRNAYIRIVDLANNNEILKYDLEEDFSTQTAVLFGRLYNKDNEWRFNAIGSGLNGGLLEFCKQYGVEVE